MLVRMNPSRVMTAAGVSILILAGCSPAAQTVDPVSPADLTAEVTERLSHEVEVPFEVECLEELAAEVGATTTCTATSPSTAGSDSPVTLILTVVEVDASTGVVSFDIAADVDEPQESDDPESEDEPEEEEESSS